MKVASWNVNSLKVRLPQVLEWIKKENIDVLMLQETKMIDENFPEKIFQELGYHSVFSGEKTYNGVAILSRFPISGVLKDIPNFSDPSRRILAATIQNIRFINLYVPNGQDIHSEKYQYKLAWLIAITKFLSQELARDKMVLVAGDFNIAPADDDVHDPNIWDGSVLTAPEVREAFYYLMKLGFLDSFRLFERTEKHFSWWDYRGGSFRRNHGLRIDLILLSQALAPFCLTANIDSAPRRWERPSDHVPILVSLASDKR